MPRKAPDPSALTLDAFLALDRDHRRLSAAVVRTSNARAALPPGSSRARVTTANARWSTACEARDRREAALRATWEAAQSVKAVAS